MEAAPQHGEKNVARSPDAARAAARGADQYVQALLARSVRGAAEDRAATTLERLDDDSATRAVAKSCVVRFELHFRHGDWSQGGLSFAAGAAASSASRVGFETLEMCLERKQVYVVSEDRGGDGLLKALFFKSTKVSPGERTDGDFDGSRVELITRDDVRGVFFNAESVYGDTLGDILADRDSGVVGGVIRLVVAAEWPSLQEAASLTYVRCLCCCCCRGAMLFYRCV